MSDYFGKETPKLGVGLMRLPKKGLHTDIEQVKHMVDLFMEAGFTYFDTAYVYMGSEAAIRKALVERYPRESYTLATKLNAMMMAPTEKTAKNQFYTSFSVPAPDILTTICSTP
ncbi:aldo/keto reductase [Lachnospiraceae bacterium 47-T17]